MTSISGIGDWIRVVNGLSAVVVTVMIALRCSRVWRRYSLSQKMTYAALFFYMIGLAWRTYEVVFEDDLPFSWSSAFVFVGHTIMLAYLLEPKSRYEHRLGDDLRNPGRSAEKYPR